MNALNPELKSQIDALAALCCAVIDRSETDSETKARPLLKALVVGGYARISDVNLQSRVEQAVLDQCRELAIHRRGELRGITGQMQTAFDELVRWDTKGPEQASKPKAANLSSFTDS